jgi:hypothetical protein
MRRPSSRQADASASTSRGFTVMVIGEPGEQVRKVHIPHWVVVLLALGWFSVLGLLFVWGFESAAPAHERAGYGAMRTAMAPAPSSRQ